MQLAVDPKSAIDVVIQRTGGRGLLRGIDGTNRYACRIKYLLRQEEVKVGDLVVTSGAAGVFPKDCPWGASPGEARTYGLYQEVEVIPARGLLHPRARCWYRWRRRRRRVAPGRGHGRARAGVHAMTRVAGLLAARLLALMTLLGSLQASSRIEMVLLDVPLIIVLYMALSGPRRRARPGLLRSGLVGQWPDRLAGG